MSECNRWKQFQVLQNKHLLLWFSGPPNQPNTEQITQPLIFPWFHLGLLHNPRFLTNDLSNKVQINTREFICVSVDVGWLSQISGSVAKHSPLPSPFPPAPPPSFIKENRRYPTAIISGTDINLFLEHDCGSPRIFSASRRWSALC